MIIESRSGKFRANLADGPDGVAVLIFQLRRGGVFKRTHCDCLDVPFHVACDRISKLVEQL